MEEKRKQIEKEISDKRKEIEKQFNAFNDSETFVIVEEGVPSTNADDEARRLQKELKKHNLKTQKLLNEFDEKKQQLELKQINLVRKKNKFFENTYIKHKIAPEDFNKYRIIKGLSNALTPRWIYIEDDFHRNNFNKYGLGIDFDMSFWPLFNDYKNKRLSDRVLRNPGLHHLIVSINDIINFPDTENFLPYFWPTSQTKSASISSTTNIIKSVQSMLGLPDNNYEIKDNELFKQLKNHPVFKYHKYVNMTKCILTSTHIIRQNAEKHIPPDIIHIFNGKKDYLINHFINLHESRVKAFKNALILIPEFHEFFIENYEKIAEEFVKDLKEQGITYSADDCEEIRSLLEAREEKEIKINGSHSPLSQIKTVSKTILIAIDNQKEAWADKVKNSSVNHTQFIKNLQGKLGIYAPSEGYLTSIWSGMWGTKTAAPEEKAIAEKILKESFTLPGFIEQNRNAMGGHIYLSAMKKMYDSIHAEVDSFRKKENPETNNEPTGIYKDLFDLNALLEKYLPSEMLNAAVVSDQQAPSAAPGRASLAPTQGNPSVRTRSPSPC